MLKNPARYIIFLNSFLFSFCSCVSSPAFNNESSIDGFAYEVLYQSVPKTEAIPYDGYQVRNGYTVWRFHRNRRVLDFEIWQRNGRTAAWPAKDPRVESPNFSYTINPLDIFWQTSRLPEIPLVDHGISPEDAPNMAYTLRRPDGTPLYANRADAGGNIPSMPCPPLTPGSEVLLELMDGTRISVQTR